MPTNKNEETQNLTYGEKIIKILSNAISGLGDCGDEVYKTCLITALDKCLIRILIIEKESWRE